MTKQQKIDWIISRHEDTNHMYDKYIPYKFHLIMVVEAFKKFRYVLERSVEGDIESRLEEIELACWGHDLIEDTRTSYNDVVKVLGKNVADIIYAVTNEKGRNRAERANSKYYEGIRNTDGAVFVKLCDRIANLQYSTITGSNMKDRYSKENPHFTRELLGEVSILNHPYKPLFDFIINVLIKGEE